jgi:hypothetical protein
MRDFLCWSLTTVKRDDPPLAGGKDSGIKHRDEENGGIQGKTIRSNSLFHLDLEVLGIPFWGEAVCSGGIFSDLGGKE